MPKLFPHKSVAEELFQAMGRNIVNIAFEDVYARDIKRIEVMEQLKRAAETFEQNGKFALAEQATRLLLKLAQPTVPAPDLDLALSNTVRSPVMPPDRATVQAPGISPEERAALRQKDMPEISDINLALVKSRDMLELAREEFADYPEVISAIEQHYKRVVSFGKSDDKLLEDLNNFTDILSAAIGEEESLEDVGYVKESKAKKILDKLNKVFGVFGFKLQEKDVEKLK